MSRLTTARLQVLPSATAAPSVSTGGSAWTYGAWVELDAALAADTQLAGAYVLGAGTGVDWDLEFGIGALGLEVGITQWVGHLDSSANMALNVVQWPVPVDGFPAGSRLVVRARRSSTTVATAVAALVYQGLGSDHVTTAASPHMAVPAGASGVTVTPNAGAWVNSAWAEVTTGLADECAITGIALTTANGLVVFEVDLGTGAAAAETVITTLRGDTGSELGWTNLYLGAPFPLAAGTRIAARVRKSDTSVTALKLTLLYLDDTALLAGAAVATAETYVWGPI